MITEVSPNNFVVLNGSGNGQCAVYPPSGTKWSLRLATTTVSAAGPSMQVSLYRGSPSGPLELVDSTNLAFASSSKIMGPVFFPGQWLWAVCTGGGAGATLTLQVYGQQGSRSDPFELSPPGEGFPQKTTTLTIPTGATTGPRIVIGSDIPAVLASWAALNSVVITAAILKYWDTTQFEWDAVGTISGVNSTFGGTYDTTNGVYVTNRVVAGAGGISYNIGSATLNTFAMATQILKSKVVANSAASAAWQDIEAIQPGTTSTPETWHTITGGIGYQNGWGDIGSGTMLGQYRLLPSPANAVQLVGAIGPGIVVDGTTLFTLPSGYRPLTTIAINVVCNKSVSGGEVPSIQIANTGVVQCFGVNVTGINQIQMCTIFPTDV